METQLHFRAESIHPIPHKSYFETILDEINNCSRIRAILGIILENEKVATGTPPASL